MNFTRVAFFILALAVILGAFGAHQLKALVSEEHMHSFQTGVQYHFYHALGLLILSISDKIGLMKHKGAVIAQWFMLIGIVLFSGSLYFLSTTEVTHSDLSFLGPITPLGGLCYIIAWIMAGISLKIELFRD